MAVRDPAGAAGCRCPTWGCPHRVTGVPMSPRVGPWGAGGTVCMTPLGGRSCPCGVCVTAGLAGYGVTTACVTAGLSYCLCPHEGVRVPAGSWGPRVTHVQEHEGRVSSHRSPGPLPGPVCPHGCLCPSGCVGDPAALPRPVGPPVTLGPRLFTPPGLFSVSPAARVFLAARCGARGGRAVSASPAGTPDPGGHGGSVPNEELHKAGGQRGGTASPVAPRSRPAAAAFLLLNHRPGALGLLRARGPAVPAPVR